MVELFRQCGILGLNCSVSVIFYGWTVPPVWYFVFELFRQCDNLWLNCSASVVFYVWTVPPVWYFMVELFRQCGILCLNCSASVIIYGWTVPPVWYFMFELFRQCGISFFIFILINSSFSKCVCLIIYVIKWKNIRQSEQFQDLIKINS